MREIEEVLLRCGIGKIKWRREMSIVESWVGLGVR